MQHDEVNKHENKSDLAVLGLAACHAKWKWMHQRPTVISITNAALFVRQPAANMRLPRGSVKEILHFFLWHKHMVLHIFAYGPKTEVAKRFFFESDVLDATLMMGWGGVGWVGHVNVRVNLLRFLMLR